MHANRDLLQCLSRYYYDNIIVESRLSTETETILRHVLYSQCQSSWPKSKRYFRGEYKLDKSFRIYTASMIQYDKREVCIRKLLCGGIVPPYLCPVH